MSFIEGKNILTEGDSASSMSCEQMEDIFMSIPLINSASTEEANIDDDRYIDDSDSLSPSEFWEQCDPENDYSLLAPLELQDIGYTEDFKIYWLDPHRRERIIYQRQMLEYEKRLRIHKPIKASDSRDKFPDFIYKRKWAGIRPCIAPIDGTSPILSLPTEIMKRIFDYLFDRHEAHKKLSNARRDEVFIRSIKKIVSPISCVCKSFYTELLPYLYDQITVKSIVDLQVLATILERSKAILYTISSLKIVAVRLKSLNDARILVNTLFYILQKCKAIRNLRVSTHQESENSVFYPDIAKGYSPSSLSAVKYLHYCSPGSTIPLSIFLSYFQNLNSLYLDLFKFSSYDNIKYSNVNLPNVTLLAVSRGALNNRLINVLACAVPSVQMICCSGIEGGVIEFLTAVSDNTDSLVAVKLSDSGLFNNLEMTAKTYDARYDLNLTKKLWARLIYVEIHSRRFSARLLPTFAKHEISDLSRLKYLHINGYLDTDVDAGDFNEFMASIDRLHNIAECEQIGAAIQPSESWWDVPYDSLYVIHSHLFGSGSESMRSLKVLNSLPQYLQTEIHVNIKLVKKNVVYFSLAHDRSFSDSDDVYKLLNTVESSDGNELVKISASGLDTLKTNLHL
ncbi:hypothetical protein V1511DRAFT_510401 [Dipodascopsis uninucleata]